MAPGFERAQYARDPLGDARKIEHGAIAGRAHIAFQGQNRGHQFVELEARLQHRAVNEARVYAGVARLPAEGAEQHVAREGRVGVQHGGEAPKEAVAVPVGRGHIVTGAAAGDHHQLLGVYGQTCRVEEAEKHVRVVELAEVPVVRVPAASVLPSSFSQPWRSISLALVAAATSS